MLASSNGAQYQGSGNEEDGGTLLSHTAVTGPYYATGSTPHAAIAQVASAVKSSALGSSVTAPDVTQSPTDATPAPAAPATTPAAAAAAAPTLTPQMLTQLQQAVQQGVSCVEGGGCDAGQIDTTIMAALDATGSWTVDELAAVQAGLNAAEPHGSGFKEQSNTGTEPFFASWFGNALQSLQGYIASVAPAPPATSTGASATSGATSGNAASGAGSELSAIAPYLSGSGNSDTSGDGTTGGDSGAQPYVVQTAPSASGGSPIGMLLIVGALGLLAWWYFHRKKKKPAKK